MHDNQTDTPDVAVAFIGTTTLSVQHTNKNRRIGINGFADVSNGVNNSGLLPDADITINPNLGQDSGPNIAITPGSVRQTISL